LLSVNASIAYTGNLTALRQFVHNQSMPFTASHAAALPLRRARLATSALVVGTMAPDFEWDSFTHAGTYPYAHRSLLRQSVDVPVLGTMPMVKAFEHGGTILGLVILSLWLFRWYRQSEPCRYRFRDLLSPRLRNGVLAVGVALAALGGIARALSNGNSDRPHCGANDLPARWWRARWRWLGGRLSDTASSLLSEGVDVSWRFDFRCWDR
jgi:Domain of unknown function (DUF4184)